MRIRQIGQHVDDMDRAVRFYESFLGQRVAAHFDPPGLGFFVLDDVRFLLDRGLPPSAVYFEVDDVSTTVERLRQDGVEITGEPHVIFRHESGAIGPEGRDEWHASFRDSEGNEVVVVSTRTPAL